jgi:GNAT superfamily N-acetyltransferase
MTNSKERYELKITYGLDEKEEEDLLTKLAQYNLEKSNGLSSDPGEPICLALRNEDNQAVGALFGQAIYRSLYIRHLWVNEKHRGHGYGKTLVKEAERIAKENGCISAFTSTYSFQAPHFYHALGYETLGVFDRLPDGIRKLFLGKSL